VVAFIYFAENVLPGTSVEKQAKAMSIYKTVGALGFLVGAAIAPFTVKTIGYVGTFWVYLGIYVSIFIACFVTLPSIDSLAEKEDKDDDYAETLLTERLVEQNPDTSPND
jgi:MFS family permease